MARMRLKVSITHYPLGEGGQDTPLHSVLNFQSRYMSGSSPVYIPHLLHCKCRGDEDYRSGAI